MDALALRSTARELVAAFVQAEGAVRAHFAGLVAAEEAVNQAFGLTDHHAISIDANYVGSGDDFRDAKRAIERMARSAWWCIVERLELRRAMSIERWKTMEQQLLRGPLPPITEENVVAFVRGQAASLEEMWGEAVAEVYEWLRPRVDTPRAAYATNRKSLDAGVGERVILSGVVERGWAGSGWRVSHWREQHLTALENVFNGLDGQGQRGKEHRSALEMAIEAAGAEGVGETPLFAFRACANRNLHLRFKRADLLAEFNRIAGGRRMKGAA